MFFTQQKEHKERRERKEYEEHKDNLPALTIQGDTYLNTVGAIRYISDTKFWKNCINLLPTIPYS